MNNLVQTIERITPTMAKRYLETSRGNRPISQDTVRSYAKTMMDGKWRLNGVPIIFDSEKRLLDGHHRLHAIIAANRAIEMSVTYGVDSDVFTTYDCGRHRSLGQILAMNGIESYNNVAAVVAVSSALVNTGRVHQNNSAKTLRMTNDMYFEKWKEDPEAYNECTRLARQLYAVARILRISWIGGIAYFLTHTGGYQFDFVKRFFSAVCNLETTGISAADELRKFILRNERNNDSKKITDEYLFAIVVKAWNAYARDKVVGYLRYMPNKEDYPTLLLNVTKR